MSLHESRFTATGLQHARKKEKGMDMRIGIGLLFLINLVSPTLWAQTDSYEDLLKQSAVSVFEKDPSYRVVKEVDYLEVELELVGNLTSVNAEALEKKLDVEYARKMSFIIPRAPREQEKLDFKNVGRLMCRLISNGSSMSYLKPYYFTCYIDAEFSDKVEEGIYCNKKARALETYAMGIVSDDNAINEINKAIEQTVELLSVEAYSIRSGKVKDMFVKELDARMRLQNK
jgi:hypothetical protein